MLIEHYAGAFPAWLAPVQTKVMSITDKQLDYAKSVRDQLLADGYRDVREVPRERIESRKLLRIWRRLPRLMSALRQRMMVVHVTFSWMALTSPGKHAVPMWKPMYPRFLHTAAYARRWLPSNAGLVCVARWSWLDEISARSFYPRPP